MTPTTTVRPFTFAVIELPSYKVLRTLPERFVRCNEENGQPILEHLFEVAEILCEHRGINIVCVLEILTHGEVYYTHSVRIDGRDGFLAARLPRSGGPGEAR